MSRTRAAIAWATLWSCAAGVVLCRYFGWRVQLAIAVGVPIWVVVFIRILPRDRLGRIVCSIGWISDIIEIIYFIAWKVRKRYDKEYKEERKRRQTQIINLSLHRNSIKCRRALQHSEEANAMRSHHHRIL